MSARSREKSRQLSGYLKDHKVQRTSGMCPWGCGSSIKNGGEALLLHLSRCRGNPKRDGRRR